MDAVALGHNFLFSGMGWWPTGNWKRIVMISYDDLYLHYDDLMWWFNIYIFYDSIWWFIIYIFDDFIWWFNIYIFQLLCVSLGRKWPMIWSFFLPKLGKANPKFFGFPKMLKNLPLQGWWCNKLTFKALEQNSKACAWFWSCLMIHNNSSSSEINILPPIPMTMMMMMQKWWINELTM